MSTETFVTVRVCRRFAASAERLFDAWLDPKIAAGWLFATAGGTMVRAEIDARVGGRFVFVDRRNGEDIEHVGEYLRIDRPRHLAFTFAVPKFSPLFTRVSIDIARHGSGCEFTLTHEGVLPDWASRTERGWAMIFDRLAHTLDLGIIVAPRAVSFERLLPGPIERVWGYLTDSGKRGKWLASGEMELRVGGSVELVFHHASLSPKPEPVPERFRGYKDGHMHRGRITRCDPPRLLTFTWPGTSGEASEVSFELTPQGENVLLVLTHSRLADRAEMVSVAGGWHAHLGVLAARLNDRELPPFWSSVIDNENEYEKLFPDE